MHRLTTDILSENILSQLDFTTFISFGGKKEQIEKILNEVYQHHPKCFIKTNKGDLSFLKEVINRQIYILKFIN